MRVWSWSKGAIRVDDGQGFQSVADFEDFWHGHGDAATEEIAEFIVDALNEKEAREAGPVVAKGEDGVFVYDPKHSRYLKL